MNRRRFLGLVGISSASVVAALGCRSHPTAQVMSDGKKDLVGNTAAGAETYKPMIDDALGKLLGRQMSGLQPASVPPPAPKRICFVGLENKSSEDLGDFKEQIIEIIDTKINNSQVFTQISRKYVEAGIRAAHLRSDELFLPANQRTFQALMEQQGHPFDYLLFATVTSGTTRASEGTQKDYLLSLELVDLHTGIPDKEMSAPIRKAYSRSRGLR